MATRDTVNHTPSRATSAAASVATRSPRTRRARSHVHATITIPQRAPGSRAANADHPSAQMDAVIANVESGAWFPVKSAWGPRSDASKARSSSYVASSFHAPGSPSRNRCAWKA